MNKISLLIYASDIAEGVKNVSITFFVISLLACLPLTACAMFMCTDSGNEDTISRWEEMRLRCKKYAKNLWTVCVIFGVLTVFAPEKKTVLLIAASEVTAVVITSSATQEILNDALQVIKSQLSEYKKAK